MNPRWTIINGVLRSVFGRDMVRPYETQSSVAGVVIDGFTLAILEDMGHTIKMQLRASLTPNDTARLVTAIGYIYPVMFGPHFETTEQGELLYGDKALEYVWGHMPRTIQEAVFNDKRLDDQYDKPN